MAKSLEIGSRCKVLDDLFNKFKEEGIDLNRFSSADIDQIKRICNKVDNLISIPNYAKIMPYFINDACREYFGFDSNDLSNKGFDFFTNLVHPDDIAAIHKTVNFYNEFPNGTNRLAFRGRRNDGEMRWLYNFDRVLNFNKVGAPQYLLAVSSDIEKVLDHTDFNRKHLQDRKDKLLLYNTLSKREREILHFIANELTSNEIGKKLFIESSTVDTHRKNILKKLQVKSSLGLVKYAFHFPFYED